MSRSASYRSWLIRLGAGAGFLALYFLVLRAVRVVLVASFLWPAVTSLDEGRVNGVIPFFTPGTTGIYLYKADVGYNADTQATQAPVSMATPGSKPYYVFKGFGDQFFLFGGFLLILLGCYRHTAYLFGFHVGISVLNSGLLMAGVAGATWSLMLMDFFIEYLTPAVSMLWVVGVYGWHRRGGMGAPSAGLPATGLITAGMFSIVLFLVFVLPGSGFAQSTLQPVAHSPHRTPLAEDFTATPMPLTRVFAIHPEHATQLHPSNARELGALLMPESLRRTLHRQTLGRAGFTRTDREDPGATYWLRELARPEVYLLPFTSVGQYNSNRVWSPNSGPAWSGKGYSHAATGGISARWLLFDVQLAPVWTAAENRSFDTARETLSGTARSIWIGGQGNFDTPVRLDSASVNRWYWGESWAKVMLGPLSAGVSNQNLWWGPGRRHSVLMTNNAPGFQHATLHTNRPLNMGLGDLQFQYVAGRLERSYYNEAAYPDDWRFLTALVVDFEPRFTPGLHLGLVRAFHLRAQDLNTRRDYFPLFQPFQKSNLPPGEGLGDGSLPDDQRASVYFSWHFPESEVTFYGEFGRTDHASDIRDFYLQPNHARAYMLGMHKVFRGSRVDGASGGVRGRASSGVRGSASGGSRGSARSGAAGSISGSARGGAPVWSLSAEIMDASNTTPSRVRLWRAGQAPNDLRFYNHGSVRHGYTHLGRGMGSPVGLAGTAWFLGLQRSNGIWDAGFMAEYTRKNRVTYLRLIEASYPDARQELELTAGGYLRRELFHRSLDVQLSAYFVQARNQHYVRFVDGRPHAIVIPEEGEPEPVLGELTYLNPLNVHVRLTVRYRLFPGILTR